MQPTTVRASWALFAAAAMPPDAPGVQHREMRRAFYAGAKAMFRLIFAVGQDDVGEAQAEAMLAALERELSQFFEAVRAGKA